MQEINISPANLEKCLKCDLCTQICPMYSVNPDYPGPKAAGPDGERYRLKDPKFFDNALKYCLNCKRCEVICPSGVKVGDIIAVNRLKYGRPSRPLRDRMLASTDLVGSLASPFAPIVNPILGLGITKSVLDSTVGISKERTFPKYSSSKFVTWFRRHAAREQEKFARKVHYFHGCYVNYNYPQLGKDFVRLMNACGYGVELLDKEKCCGVALIANGFGKQASKQAAVNLASIRKAGGEVLTTSSTCTFTMRDEYDHVLGLENADVRDRILLATKWLYDKLEAGEIRLAFREDFKMQAAYHTACHMQKMGWQQYSIRLLQMIPGMELTVLDQHCCGISGTFGFKKENYGYSKQISSELVDDIHKSGAGVVITDCETCKWQIEGFTGLEVLNPVSVLAQAIDYEKTLKLNNEN